MSIIPPDFGITILGSSHGFDAKGSTTGFIIWVYGKGIMIDPPPFSSQYLKKMGIPSVLICAIILTHCHADHDAGTFNKILGF
jgi:glyoxylase-like metal-dependent hydrolase (beta-lactamase superfamily II)